MFQWELTCIVRQLLVMEIIVSTTFLVDEDPWMVMVAYIDDILITQKVTLDGHHCQVGNAFDLRM